VTAVSTNLRNDLSKNNDDVVMQSSIYCATMHELCNSTWLNTLHYL